MRHWAIALRIGVGLVSVTMLLVLLAQWAGVLCDPSLAQKERRTALCECLAIHCSLAAQNSDPAVLDEIARTVALRNPDLAYLSVERANGTRLLDVGDAAVIDGHQPKLMEATVPIFRHDRPWGQIRVAFRETAPAGWPALGVAPALRLTTFFATVGLALFFAYALFLVRGLTGSSAALLPERVRETLDTFAEGVLVLDDVQRIAYANRSFRSLVGEAQEPLEGKCASLLPWVDAQPAGGEWPWELAAREGVSQRATLELQGAFPLPHMLAVQATPILDDNEKVYGTLATFHDVTKIERMNSRLRKVLELLRSSRQEIRRQNLDLQRLATVDSLTGCINRRELFLRLEGLFAAAARYQLSLSCLIVDVDHFKSVNDTHGHAAGDDVLVAVAAALRAAIRDADFVCRYGGEEFCVVLPHTNLEAALPVAERVRQAIACLEFSSLSITASVGVSAVSSRIESPGQLIGEADQAMYEAKKAGRNRVVVFPNAADSCTHSAGAPAWEIC